MNCKCGNKAVAYMVVPTGAYAGLRPITQDIPVCEYHKGKAKKQGHDIKPLY